MTMHSVLKILPLMVLVLAPVLTFVFAASTWDVSPTPLDQMQEAGVSISVDAISKILADPKQDVQLRYSAAMALGQLADKSAIPALVASLSDSDPNVRIGAAGALMYLPDEGIVQVLCETAVHDGNSGPVAVRLHRYPQSQLTKPLNVWSGLQATNRKQKR